MNEPIFYLDGLEPELQLRLTALVMGEASDLEREQLEELLQQRNDAASWYRQLQQLHAGLAALAATPAADDDDWKLSTDRRQQLLAVLDGETPNPLPATDKLPPAEKTKAKVAEQQTGKQRLLRKSPSRRKLWWAGIAASLLLVLGATSLQLSNRSMRFADFSPMSKHAPPEFRAPEFSAPESGSGEFAGGSATTYFFGDESAPAESVDFGQRQAGLARRLQREAEEAPRLALPAVGTADKSVPSDSKAVATVNRAPGSDAMEGEGYGGMSMGSMGAGSMGGMRMEVTGSTEGMRGGYGRAERDSAGEGFDFAGPETDTLGTTLNQSPTQLGDDVYIDAIPPNEETAQGQFSPNQGGQQTAQGSGGYAAQGQPSSSTPNGNSVFGVWGSSGAGAEDGEASQLYRSPANSPVASENSQLPAPAPTEATPTEATPTEATPTATATTITDGGSILLGGIRREARPRLNRKSALGVSGGEGLRETAAASERFSTFSLHVSDVSFKLALAAFDRGEWPATEKIRIEEFVNAMDYRDPLATPQEQVACQLEQAIHPYLMQRNLLRISLRTAATGRSQPQPLRLTLLLDNSGSMERPDRRQTVRRAIESLAQQLTANDQVTLISFANTPRLLAERVSGAKLDELVQLVENLPSEGGTNLEVALQLALEKSVEQARSTGTASAGLDRIIMMTDGAVNLGDADPQRLSELVLQMRQAGIAFDAAGISAYDLNDEVLEALARQGDGRYYLLDASEEVSAGFADQIAGALRPAAKNVKVQVEFNPQRVGQYKLLGFEKHLLNPEDFRNDQVDAAELAAAEAGVALYHFEPQPDGQGDVGSVSVRYQDLSTGLMVERRWPIPYQPQTARLEQADPRVRIATVAALFAAKLRGDAVAYGTDLNALATLLAELPSSYGSELRVEQLKFMIETARQLATQP